MTNQLLAELEMANRKLEEKDKEIEILNDLLHKANDEVVSYTNECIRLNNIIDELEKWLKEDKEYSMNNFECGRCFNVYDILNKLKELKEGKK